MAIPEWNDPALEAGVMVKGALWLLQQVGEGNRFTKAQLREVFPGVSQADRRIRDLRAFGWVILTNTEDATLTAQDQRFVKAGVPVWDPVARRAAAPQKAVSAKEKKAVMARDSYMCTSCGISGGEEYLDDSNQAAVLSVTRLEVILPDGEQEILLTTECKRCRAGFDGAPVEVDDVLAAIKGLDQADRARLLRWMNRGRRGSTALERAWNAYRRLPEEAKSVVRADLLN
ncbi:hypothetical protein [Lentzea waywayandensis]|nr:hypothetical protein [Lentzea waywayandensis]